MAFRSPILFSLALLVLLLAPTGARAQDAPSGDKVPIERCDVLPVILLRIDGADMRFLVDTGATTVLNVKTFTSSRSKRIRVSSWSGVAATSAREVFLPELSIGSYRLTNLRLPAIDLTPIGKACGGQIDGILGVDLLDRMGATIDFQRRLAIIGPRRDHSEKDQFAEHEAAMTHCLTAFNKGSAEEFGDCLDPDVLLYTPWGEFRGREQVIQYLKDRFLNQQPNPQFEMRSRDMRLFGDAVWHSYEYRIDSPTMHIVGRGMMICRKNGGKWRMLNMHNSIAQPEPGALKPQF